MASNNQSLPKAPLSGAIDKPIPADYLTSVEVLSHVIAMWWDRRDQPKGRRLFWHDAGCGTPLGELEQRAHVRSACDIVWRAASAGDIGVQIEHARGKFRRITPGDWSSIPMDRIEPSFVRGKLHVDPHDCSMAWAEGLPSACRGAPTIARSGAVPTASVPPDERAPAHRQTTIS